MKSDLQPIRAKLKWAEERIPQLQESIERFKETCPYTIWQEIDKESRGTFCKVRFTQPIPDDLLIEISNLVHQTRTSLDHLVCVLALRNNRKATRSTSFPVCMNEEALLQNGHHGVAGIKKIDRLSEADRDIIVRRVKPYAGGNDLLFALHQLSIVDKHNRPLKAAGFLGSVSISDGAGDFKIGGDINTWGYLDDERTIIWVGEGSHFAIQFSFDIAFNEIGHTPSRPIVETLKEIVVMVNSIVDFFE